MTSITWAGPRCVQELATFLGPQNRTQGRCALYLDQKTELLQRASFPEGSKSPLEFDTYTLNHAAKVGQLEVTWVGEFEQELARRNVTVRRGSAAFNHFAFFKSKPRARRMSDDSMMIVFGSQDLSQRFSLTSDQAGFGLTAFSTEDTILASKCPKVGFLNFGIDIFLTAALILKAKASLADLYYT